jgi:hypothetical protein
MNVTSVFEAGCGKDGWRIVTLASRRRRGHCGRGVPPVLLRAWPGRPRHVSAHDGSAGRRTNSPCRIPDFLPSARQIHSAPIRVGSSAGEIILRFNPRLSGARHNVDFPLDTYLVRLLGIDGNDYETQSPGG